jgi:hypothetical protein
LRDATISRCAFMSRSPWLFFPAERGMNIGLCVLQIQVKSFPYLCRAPNSRPS